MYLFNNVFITDLSYNIRAIMNHSFAPYSFEEFFITISNKIKKE